MATITTSDFNARQALGGMAVGYKNSDGDIVKVYNFRLITERCAYNYCADVNNVTYVVDDDGMMYDDDGNEVAQLVMLSMTLVVQSDGPLTRVDGTTVNLDSLNAKEEVAMRCLEAIIGQCSDPLQYDNVKIQSMVKKSLLLAQEFVNQAATYRAATTA